MSALRERLRRLRAVTPGPGPDPAANPEPYPEPDRQPDPEQVLAAEAGHTTTPGVAKPSLKARLERIDPARRRAPAAPMAERDLARQLGAEQLAPGLLRLSRRLTLSRRHGRVPLRASTALAPALANTLPAETRAAASDPAGWRFIDTETSGLAGGTGTWVFCCGIAQLDGNDLLLRQWLLTRLDAEPALLGAIADALEGARLMISYNGKSFDLPLLETRFRLAGPVPAAVLAAGASGVPDAPAHLDLLMPVRRAFAGVWPDCRLCRAERELLGFQRADDLPGAEAPAAWLDWLRRGDPSRLGAVLRHNRLDLVSLAALLPALAAVLADPGRHGADLGALARAELRRGDVVAARALLLDAGATLSPRERLLLATLHRRLGAWDEARRLWEALAAVADPAALEALAKYHEHRSGDLTAALGSVQRMPSGPAREHRRRRLLRKLSAAAERGRTRP